MILGFVKEHSGEFDRYAIARILTGQGKRVTAHFGKLPLCTDDEIITCVDALIADGICIKEKMTAGKHKDKTVVIFSGDVPHRHIRDSPADSLFLEQLKQWRMTMADELSVPLYKIAHNKSLEQIALLLPSSHKELLAIDGIGPQTLRKHATSLLQLVAAYKEKKAVHAEHKYPTDTDELMKTFSRASFRGMAHLDHLNDEQVLAACLDAPRIACVAGAGSGKTAVLIARIIHAIMIRKVPARNILAVTFTKKAAQEMRDRLIVSLGEQAKQVTVVTFNSFCEHILQQYATAVYSKPQSVIDDAQKRFLLLKACRSTGDDQGRIIRAMASALGVVYPDPHQTLEAFVGLAEDIYEFVKHEALSFDYLEECLGSLGADDKDLLRAVIDVLKQFVALKQELAVRDYTDQLSEAVSMLLVHQNLLVALQRRYTHILVDEFQDINVIQQQLVDMLLTPHTHLFVVGDPRQSIFGFRGSKPEFLLTIKNTLHDVVVVDLRKNYRSTPSLVALANTIVSPLGYGREQIAAVDSAGDHGTRGTFRILECVSAEEEALFVAQNIKLLRLKDDVAYNQFFVLARTNAQLDLVASVFRQCDLDYVRRDDAGFQTPLAHQVVLATVHAIKGLEAHAVFVIGMVSGKFPLVSPQLKLLQSVKSHAAYDAVEEELRLFYVAVTRARRHLFLLWYRRDERSNKSKSPFLTNDLYAFQS